MLLLLGLAAMRPGPARGQIFEFNAEDPFPISSACKYITDLNTRNNTKACAVVSTLIDSLLALPDDACANATEAGFGRQREPYASDTRGNAAPQPLTGAGGPAPAEFDGSDLSRLLAAEGATYHFLWQALRNIKYFWPCSRPMGGSLDGYLVPRGWAPVGAGDQGVAGIYSLEEDGRRLPMMAVIVKRAAGGTAASDGGGASDGGDPAGAIADPGGGGATDSSGGGGASSGGGGGASSGGGGRAGGSGKGGGGPHLVVALRGSNTKFEWARNFMYDLVDAPPFELGSAFAASSPQGAFPGGVHRGFSLGFASLWPALLEALKAEAAGVKTVTLTGHSQGGAIATLLAWGAAEYLKAAGLDKKVQLDLVTFGAPNVGDKAFQRSLRRAANPRRVVFENDAFTLLPCVGKGMPACPDAPVKTAPAKGAKGLSIDGYEATAGQVTILGADMPAEAGPWSQTSHATLKRTRSTMDALHACSYVCYLRGYSAGANTTDNSCLLRRPGDASLLQSNGYCTGFPHSPEDWPAPSLDRQLYADGDPALPENGTRPPMFDFRSYKDAASWGCDWKPNGRLIISVEHKPIPGVTSEMLVWHWNNLGNGTAVHPADGKRYPNFLLFHPRDHIKHWATRSPLESKSGRVATYWREIQATGCTETGDPASPYACPSGPSTPNPGVVRSTPRSVWMAFDQVNSKSFVRDFGPSNARFAVRGCNENGACAWSVRTEHDWKDQAGGLQVQSQVTVGIYWAGAKPKINPNIVSMWRNGLDADKKCQRVALHIIEEFGTLEHWLPGAYAESQKPGGGSIGGSSGGGAKR